jgi:ParB/RepB/Spo0J family partition protein
MASRIAAAAAQGPFVVQSKSEPTTLRVPLDSLTTNPYQPRSSMDEAKLKELTASIEQNGLLQPIAVKREGDGWVIIAGHRRTEAFRRLRASAPDAEKARWASIPALELAGVDAIRLATLSYVENEQRENLSILDIANAINRMFEERLYDTVEAAAKELGKSVTRVKDLRRIARAPNVIKQSLGTGLRVVVGTNEDGSEKAEIRKLELQHTLAFCSIHEHLVRSNLPPKKVEARIEAAIRRALTAQWSAKRAEEYARDVIKGKEALKDAPDSDAPESVYVESSTRFTIDKRKLQGASPDQRAALDAALKALLGTGQPGA